MKCLITEKETKDRTKNFPLSREGREILDKLLKVHNEKIFEKYKKDATEKNNGVEIEDKVLNMFAPKLNKRTALTLLSKREESIIKTRNDLLGV